MTRVVFLIDGFNLYHSVREAEKDMQQSTKWLDIRSLCSSYLYNFGKKAVISEIIYFSALANHILHYNPEAVQRHLSFIDCLKNTGISIELGKFKRNEFFCKQCQKKSPRFEEKETDVAISVKILELFHTDACDMIIVVTGDTDIAPAVRTANQLFSRKKIIFGFPYKRFNNELKTAYPESFNIRRNMYIKHQFPDIVHLADGRSITKPSSW